MKKSKIPVVIPKNKINIANSNEYEEEISDDELDQEA